ncbi:MAG: SDR family NAD(P)-dependent oxidoreductase [Bacteroidota bacterium]
MNTINSKQFALITGASQGLGKCFALELASRKINTILVALSNENIHLVAEESRKMGVESYYYETDISIKENILALANQVNSTYNVNILVNNAGCGGTKSFIDCDVDYIDRIIQLNVMSISIMTHQLLPNLLKQDKSYILNVSSMASFSPIGFKTVYPASKRFIQHFSRGLYQELKKTNVFVSVVHPGPMKTNKDVSQRIELQGILGKIGLVSPEKAAKISIHQLFKKDTLILLGWANKLNWVLMTLIPIWIKLPILSRAVEREISFKLA